MANKKHFAKISRIRESTHDNIDNILDKTQSISKSSKKIISHQKEKAIKVKDDISNYIQKKPKRSVLIAAGIGALLAKLMTRKER